MHFLPPRCVAAVAGLSLLGLGAGCVREHTLFEDTSNAGDGGTSGTGGTDVNAGGRSGSNDESGGEGGSTPSVAGSAGSVGSVAPGPPWQKATCVAALSAGTMGDACVGDFNCSASADCCEIVVICKAGALFVQNACDGCPTSCSADSDCAANQLCENYQCAPCPNEACPTSWTSVTRNGCSVCVPPSACKSDKECGDGMTCSAGLSCLPGCKADPNCCFGNQCVSGACGTLTGLDCLIVGCQPGELCKAGGEPPQCKCDEQSGQWQCSPTSSDVCVAR